MEIHIPLPLKLTSKIRHISLEQINQAAKDSFVVVKNYLELERRLIRKGKFMTNIIFELF